MRLCRDEATGEAQGFMSYNLSLAERVREILGSKTGLVEKGAGPRFHAHNLC